MWPGINSLATKALGISSLVGVVKPGFKANLIVIEKIPVKGKKH
jgi:imidazolonepropionase-like amidohydrolase